MGYEQALEVRARLSRRINHDPFLVEQRQSGLAVAVTDIERRAIERYGQHGLRDGEPIFWSTAMCELLTSVAPTIPEWTLRESAMPCPSGFMFFSKSIGEVTSYRVRAAVRGLGFERSDFVDGMDITVWVELLEGDGIGTLLPSMVSFWQFGQSQIGRLNEKDTRYTQWIATAFALMEQTILVKSPERAPRSTRRRLGPDGETPIQIVKLRRSEREGVSKKDGSETPEWSCSWVVRGHWRQHYYPKTNDHRPLFILPYVKGPEDKPLKTQADRVFVVDR